jgi:hypothetical protein
LKPKLQTKAKNRIIPGTMAGLLSGLNWLN